MTWRVGAEAHAQTATLGLLTTPRTRAGDATVERKLAGVVRLDGGRQLARRRIAGNASTSDRVDVRSRARRCVR